MVGGEGLSNQAEEIEIQRQAELSPLRSMSGKWRGGVGGSVGGKGGEELWMRRGRRLKA